MRLKMLGVAAALALVIVGPDDIEAFVAPVAGPTTGRVYFDDGDKLCWLMEFDKLRQATPSVFSWTLRTANGDQFTLGAYAAKTGEAYRLNETAGKATHAVYNLCARRPRGVLENYSLTAYGRYNVWHGLWTVPRSVGPFN